MLQYQNDKKFLDRMKDWRPCKEFCDYCMKLIEQIDGTKRTVNNGPPKELTFQERDALLRLEYSAFIVSRVL